MGINDYERQLASDLFEALHPLLRVIHATRTLSQGKLGILRVLSEHGRTTTTALAKSVGVSQQGVSLAANELESAGFVERLKDETDKRKVWLQLTERGSEKLSAESNMGRLVLERMITTSLTEDDRVIAEAAIPVLRKISQERSDDH
ncbi:MarR family winged helix-turn-helix transcriptional regulator [Arthrobacter sp. NPDC058097]|uniref:MarR family winged helix-turn-helix transcriptional regulator n=1 Tax=Arthrobacter sp. NPDC058097 TaxID=3346340 RepID=UPI0036DC77BC